MIAVNVNGGTGAGKRRPLREKPEPWAHVCRENPSPTVTLTVQLAGFFTACPVCGARRPE